MASGCPTDLTEVEGASRPLQASFPSPVSSEIKKQPLVFGMNQDREGQVAGMALSSHRGWGHGGGGGSIVRK